MQTVEKKANGRHVDTPDKAAIQTAAALQGWLAGLADHVGAPVTLTLDMVLKACAEPHGFRPMRRRRVR